MVRQLSKVFFVNTTLTMSSWGDVKIKARNLMMYRRDTTVFSATLKLSEYGEIVDTIVKKKKLKTVELAETYMDRILLLNSL